MVIYEQVWYLAFLSPWRGAQRQAIGKGHQAVATHPLSVPPKRADGILRGGEPLRFRRQVS